MSRNSRSQSNPFIIDHHDIKYLFSMPRVSVVIPTYNCSAYIEETILGIRAQEIADLEILIIDDGSTDDSVSIARSFGDLRVIVQENSGVSVARNRGLKEAAGEFIAFLDHDDLWLPGHVKTQLEAFDRCLGVDVVFTNFTRWLKNPTTGQFAPSSAFLAEFSSEVSDGDFSGWIYHQMLMDSQVLTSTALARTAVVRAAGGFNESLPFSEDWDFWLRISRTSKFMKLRQSSVLYRQHPMQGSRIVRPIDYRTRLLRQASKQWGICSQDGRCIDERRFRRQLAAYSISFGLGHLRHNSGANRFVAARAFIRAFFTDATNLRSLAYLIATPLGWRPKW